MRNKYHIKIVPFNPVEHDLLRYQNINEVGFTVGYLVYQNNQHIKSADMATVEVRHDIRKLDAEGGERPNSPEKEHEGLSLQSNRAARRAYQLQTAEEARNSSKKTSEATLSDGDDKLKASSQKSTTKSGKGLLAMKLKIQCLHYKCP